MEPSPPFESLNPQRQREYLVDRRTFLHRTVAGGAAWSTGFHIAQASLAKQPRITFYGATQQVSGSCHLLETESGLYLVDCGLFFSDVDDRDKANREFPFDPADVKAVLLTHAHVDHIGRLPVLYEQGFRGPVLCTDATRDLTQMMLDSSASFEADAEDPLYARRSSSRVQKLLEVLPYNQRMRRAGIDVRYTDAGHILGSAMVEVWVGGFKILFSGDMGPDTAPILCRPTQHFEADAVLVESTYGPSPRQRISYDELGRRIMKVIDRGGSVLFPCFAVHKTQTLIYVLHRLAEEGILDPSIPIFSDSSTARKATRIYDLYPEYRDAQASAISGSLFYRGRYREGRDTDTLKTHGKGPAIYISTSGMLDHAAAPKHLYHMAADPRNAVFLIGYQAPGSVGRKLQDGARQLALPWDELRSGRFETEFKEARIELEVDRVPGFSSHARGQQILEWLSRFRRLGAVYVVHGEKDRAKAMAGLITKMGIAGSAPAAGQSFGVHTGGDQPGEVPELPAVVPNRPSVVDQ